MPLYRFLLAIGLLLPAFALAEDPDTARFSYPRMYEILYQFHTLPPEATDRLVFAIRLRDRDGRVPDDLAVHIDYGKQRLDVDSDLFGMLDLPFSPRLASSNASVITNQPDGSMEFGLAIMIRRPPDTSTIDVDWLLAGMRQADQVMAMRARVAPQLVPRAVGVILKFAGDTPGAVIIKGFEEDVEYRADEYNTVNIPLDATELPESIEVTDQPLVIFPLFEN